MKIDLNRIVILSDQCPAGGNHQSGTSGEWLGRCVKCGQAC